MSNSKNTKYLVLGGEGFIGRNLVHFLRSRGNFVDNVDIKVSREQDLRKIKLSNLTSYSGCFFPIGFYSFSNSLFLLISFFMKLNFSSIYRTFN